MRTFGKLYGRHGSEEFAHRCQKNLDYIVQSARKGEDVHPVTQAISALLGIFVFPWERAALDAVKKAKLPVLWGKGWPKWSMEGRRVVDLGTLVELLRNSVAHGNVKFSSDSRNPEEVTIIFRNHPNGSDEPNWTASITADQLIEFCRHFTCAIIRNVE